MVPFFEELLIKMFIILIDYECVHLHAQMYLDEDVIVLNNILSSMISNQMYVYQFYLDRNVPLKAAGTRLDNGMGRNS